ncbi:MAG: OmpP1/FadL family transporter [Alphaproteobacteria bacterium]|nr:OmpP1/FadL family transporter [Alphaproteobacteria bacterium]
MKKIYLSAVALTAFSIATAAHAAGFQLNEYSATGMGRAFAGQGVVGDDYSALGYNPAGMQLNDKSGAHLVTSVISVKSEARQIGGPATGHTETRITRVLPSFMAQYKLADKTTLGFGIYTPFGLATNYKEGWYGAAGAMLSSMDATNGSLGVSQQVTDWLTLGAALNVQRIEATLKTAATRMHGDDWAAGYTLGATITPVKQARLGVAYRSKVSHELKGNILSPFPGNVLNGDIKAKVTTPETLTFSGAYDVDDALTLSATARYTRWSRFDRLTVMGLDAVHPVNGPVLQDVNENWRNTWFYALGADYKVVKDLTLRVGTAYDQSVIRSPEFRTSRIPDGRRIWGSLGASYAMGNWQFDAGYSHLWVKSGDALNESAPAQTSRYHNAHADMASIGVQYKF